MDLLIDIIGWAGSVMLCLCGVPQVYETFKKKTVNGLSLGMLLAWHLGGFFMFIYVAFRTPELPLLSNYGLNLLVTSCLLLMYLRYRNND